MIELELLKDAGVLLIAPKTAISADDIRQIARVLDPFIREKGKLNGLLIDVPSFPGWDSFGALIDDMKFVYDHHRKIDRVAHVMDSAFLKIVPKIAAHFTHSEIKIFGSEDKDRALAWLKMAYGPAPEAY
jgi:SpoIIAA-like